MASTTNISSTTQEISEPRLFGLLAEFSEASNLISAAAAIGDAGYKRWDCYSPFPVHGLDRVMRLKPTMLPWMVFAGGFAGATGALALAWFCNAYAYPLIFSGKPYWSLPANIPVAFPLTILLASITTFFGLWALTGLPRPHHPLFTSERFRRVTDDGFFIAIEATDPCYHAATTTELLRRLGAIAVEEIKD